MAGERGRRHLVRPERGTAELAATPDDVLRGDGRCTARPAPGMEGVNGRLAAGPLKDEVLQAYRAAGN